MLAASLLLSLLACAPGEEPAPQDLEGTFQAAAAESDVPRDLLVAVSYALTRLDDRRGESNRHRAVGVMNLRLDDGTPSALEAAENLGLPVESVWLDRAANVRAGAWVLSDLALEWQELSGEPVDTLESWFPVVAAYAGLGDASAAESFADQVYDILQLGLVVETPDGQWLTIEPHELPWRDAAWEAFAGSALSAQWVSASSSNYTNSSRGPGDIDMVVIHTMQGSYSGCISWFQNGAASASTHYVMRSSDGQITQMVDEEDIAWHAGHWDTNERSVGIEHEGYVEAPDTWYTDAMYRSSAALVRDICDRNGFPCDRDHVIGHYEVPGCPNEGGGGASCHTDPGSGWDWDYFMGLVDGSGSGGALPSLLSDGPKTGRLEIEAHVSGPGQTGTCDAPITGSASGGVISLTASCVPDSTTQAEEVGELKVQLSGTVVNGTDVEGRVALEGYGDAWAGTIESDGGLKASWTGSHDLGGSTGVVSYTAWLKVEP
jgi:hypothetical protein